MLKSIGRYRNMSNEISLVMGSSSDWSTMKEAANILDEFGVKYDKAVISAHRMPCGFCRRKSHYCRSWRCGSLAWNDCCQYRFAGYWRAGAVTCFKWDGFIIVDRANAGRRTCCYDGNRCFRRQERCFVGFGNSRNHKSENSA